MGWLIFLLLLACDPPKPRKGKELPPEACYFDCIDKFVYQFRKQQLTVDVMIQARANCAEKFKYVRCCDLSDQVIKGYHGACND